MKSKVKGTINPITNAILELTLTLYIIDPAFRSGNVIIWETFNERSIFLLDCQLHELSFSAYKLQINN